MSCCKIKSTFQSECSPNYVNKYDYIIPKQTETRSKFFEHVKNNNIKKITAMIEPAILHR